MGSKHKHIIYSPSKTAMAFHLSNAFVRMILGAVGTGKSVACIMECVSRGFEQEPSPDGVRRTRWAFIRATYPELQTTTLATLAMWFDETVMTVSGKAPITCVIDKDMGDGTRAHIEILLMSIDSPIEADMKLRSLELSGIFMNESRELCKEVLMFGAQRVGRYPQVIAATEEHARFDGATWHGIIMDTNPPDTAHWLYKYFEEEHRNEPSIRIFKQPGALIRDEKGDLQENPDAENIENLKGGYDYYWNIVKVSPETVDVDVCGEYGSISLGKPVYKEDYEDKAHCPGDDYPVDRRLPIIIGFDFGLYPAAVFAQFIPGSGTLVILDELAPEDITLESFIEEHLVPHIVNNYNGMQLQGIGDPAGISRSALAKGNSFQVLAQHGIPAKPATTNDITPRIDAVKFFLKRRGGFLLSNKCVKLRRGFISEYKFDRVAQRGARGRFREKPEKNDASHPADALQYLCHGVRHNYAIRRAPRITHRPSQTLWA